MKKFLGKYFNDNIPLFNQWMYHSNWFQLMTKHLQQIEYGAQTDEFDKNKIVTKKKEIPVDGKSIEKYRYLRDNLIENARMIYESKELTDKYTLFLNSYACSTFPRRVSKLGKILWAPNDEITPFEYYEVVKKDKKIYRSTKKCIPLKIE